jgi:Protein kinase domain
MSGERVVYQSITDSYETSDPNDTLSTPERKMAITFAHARIRPSRIDRPSAVAFMRLGAPHMTPDPNDALELARRIADGEAVDLEKLEANNPDLARGMRKLGLLAKAMQTATPAGTSWGHLQQLQLAGHGGFGEVYRAYDPTLDRIVALKLKREAVSSELSSGRDFVAEARRLARVRHPHVLAVHGASYHNNRAGLWADWIEGETLSARLQRSGPLRGAELLRVLRELAEAMDAVHKAGLAHGDIKASNVMLDAQGHLILMDFDAIWRQRSPMGSPAPWPSIFTPLACWRICWQPIDSPAMPSIGLRFARAV